MKIVGKLASKVYFGILTFDFFKNDCRIFNVNTINYHSSNKFK